MLITNCMIKVFKKCLTEHLNINRKAGFLITISISVRSLGHASNAPLHRALQETKPDRSRRVDRLHRWRLLRDEEGRQEQQGHDLHLRQNPACHSQVRNYFTEHLKITDHLKQSFKLDFL